jgi:hypothetical protein
MQSESNPCVATRAIDVIKAEIRPKIGPYQTKWGFLSDKVFEPYQTTPPNSRNPPCSGVFLEILTCPPLKLRSRKSWRRRSRRIHCRPQCRPRIGRAGRLENAGDSPPKAKKSN